MPSALNTAAPIKVKNRSTDRISPCLNNNSVNEIKIICEQLKENGGKLGSQFTVVYKVYKEAMTACNKVTLLSRKDYIFKIITENAGNCVEYY